MKVPEVSEEGQEDKSKYLMLHLSESWTHLKRLSIGSRVEEE